MTDAPTTVRTPRLVLRPPTEADRPFWVALHRDPRTYTHAPHAMAATDEEAGRRFDDAVADWDVAGFGYWVAEATDGAGPVGVAGLRRADHDGFLNLYYRLSLGWHGRGLGREAARYAVAHAVEWLPDLPVQALVKEHNHPSMATALAAGLERAGSRPLRDDRPGEPESTILQAPRARRLTRLDDDAREAVLDLWCRVNDAGGAVGFLPGAPRERVAEALDVHEQGMARGAQVLLTLEAAGGDLVGLGFWAVGRNPLLSHVRTAYRVMTDPDRRGRGLGRVLLAAMHRCARDDGAEIAVLGVRSGYGTSRFYRDSGYVETGRVAGAIRVAPGDDRDDITMARRLDGRELLADGRD